MDCTVSLGPLFVWLQSLLPFILRCLPAFIPDLACPPRTLAPLALPNTPPLDGEHLHRETSRSCPCCPPPSPIPLLLFIKPPLPTQPHPPAPRLRYHTSLPVTRLTSLASGEHEYVHIKKTVSDKACLSPLVDWSVATEKSIENWLILRIIPH